MEIILTKKKFFFEMHSPLHSPHSRYCSLKNPIHVGVYPF
uniref:Uncharacterized protein n=1 Tax=Ascaris lumbricoides TaxID=6252 RepID=A0A0M3IHK0_ASCLU